VKSNRGPKPGSIRGDNWKYVGGEFNRYFGGPMYFQALARRTYEPNRKLTAEVRAVKRLMVAPATIAPALTRAVILDAIGKDNEQPEEGDPAVGVDKAA
jgi:hypothetical protein